MNFAVIEHDGVPHNEEGHDKETNPSKERGDEPGTGEVRPIEFNANPPHLLFTVMLEGFGGVEILWREHASAPAAQPVEHESHLLIAVDHHPHNVLVHEHVDIRGCVYE